MGGLGGRVDNPGICGQPDGPSRVVGAASGRYFIGRGRSNHTCGGWSLWRT